MVIMGSPKIKRPPRGRSSELAQYLARCGIPETPPDEVRRALEDAAVTTRRDLRAALRRGRRLRGLSTKQADDLARLEAATPEPDRSVALAAAAAGEIPGWPGYAQLLARALLARNAAASANIRLAVTYALGVDPRGDVVSRLDPNDLVQECMIAVMHTAEVYDRTRGRTGHSSFANACGWWLRHYAERALREQGHDFAPPGAALSSRTRVIRAVDAHEGRTGERPTVEQLAEATRRPARICRQVEEWMAGGFVFGTTDRMVQVSGDGDAARWLDLQPDNGPDPADVAARAEAEAVGAAVDALPPDQRDVIRALHGLGCEEITRTEIARRTGRTRAQVEALRLAGEAALRAALQAHAYAGIS